MSEVTSARATGGDALDTDDPFMTVNEIAEVLRVHRAAVYRMMAEGRLPYKQVSLRTRRVRTSAVKKLLDSMS